MEVSIGRGRTAGVDWLRDICMRSRMSVTIRRAVDFVARSGGDALGFEDEFSRDIAFWASADCFLLRRDFVLSGVVVPAGKEDAPRERE